VKLDDLRRKLRDQALPPPKMPCWLFVGAEAVVMSPLELAFGEDGSGCLFDVIRSAMESVGYSGVKGFDSERDLFSVRDPLAAVTRNMVRWSFKVEASGELFAFPTSLGWKKKEPPSVRISIPKFVESPLKALEGVPLDKIGVNELSEVVRIEAYRRAGWPAKTKVDFYATEARSDGLVTHEFRVESRGALGLRENGRAFAELNPLFGEIELSIDPSPSTKLLVEKGVIDDMDRGGKA
jgi:hypothetical protein